MRRVAQSFIDQLLDRVDLADLVRSVVPLKQRGGRLWACCPFHEEKTPSFCVNAVEGFYKCFGCGEGGDAISFLTKTRGLSFMEAVEALAEMAGTAIVYDGESPAGAAGKPTKTARGGRSRPPDGSAWAATNRTQTQPGGDTAHADEMVPESMLEDDALPWTEVEAAPAGADAAAAVSAARDDTKAAAAAAAAVAVGEARQRRAREELVRILERATTGFARALQSAAGEEARRYLAQRGVSKESVTGFGIGYAPSGFDVMREAFGADSLPQLEQVGLVIRRDEERGGKRGRGEYFDRFRERVMFPIRDRRGRVVGFGGRALGDAKPKYLNSPETVLFHKGREVYGLFEARQARKNKLQRLILVEGYMDVVSLHQGGFTEAVAALGTAATADQFTMMFRSASEVVCCFDGDNAGRAAGWKALQTALPLLTDDRRLSFLFMPDGEDPDSLLRQRDGAQRMQDMLNAAVPFADYFFDELTRGLVLTGVDDRSLLAHRAEPLIASLPHGTRATLLRDRLREIVRPFSRDRGRPVRSTDAGVRARVAPPLTRLVKWLARSPVLIDELDACWPQLADAPGEDFDLLRRIAELIRSGGIRTTGELLGRLASDTAAFERLTSFLGEHVAIDEAAQRDEFRSALARVVEQLERRARRAGTSPAGAAPMDEEAMFLADWQRKKETKGI